MRVFNFKISRVSPYSDATALHDHLNMCQNSARRPGPAVLPTRNNKTEMEQISFNHWPPFEYNDRPQQVPIATA